MFLPVNGRRAKKPGGGLSDPKPSDDQVLKALNSLAVEGKADRDPPLSAGQRPGTTYKWRLANNLTSDEASYRSEVRLKGESSPQEENWEDVSNGPS